MRDWKEIYNHPEESELKVQAARLVIVLENRRSHVAVRLEFNPGNYDDRSTKIRIEVFTIIVTHKTVRAHVP